MTPDHRQPFADAMTVLAEALETELSARRMEIYWTVLRRFDWPVVERALATALERKWFKFPQIGELIELIQGSATDHRDAAEQAWRQLWKALDTAGTYRSLFCEDRVLAQTVRELFGGWPEAGMLPRPESDNGPMYRVRQKEFVAAYVSLAKDQRAYDPYLMGRIEAENMPQQLADHGQGAVVTYLPRQGTPEAVELAALLPDHPIARLSAGQGRQALPAGETHEPTPSE